MGGKKVSLTPSKRCATKTTHSHTTNKLKLTQNNYATQVKGEGESKKKTRWMSSSLQPLKQFPCHLKRYNNKTYLQMICERQHTTISMTLHSTAAKQKYQKVHSGNYKQNNKDERKIEKQETAKFDVCQLCVFAHAKFSVPF